MKDENEKIEVTTQEEVEVAGTETKEEAEVVSEKTNFIKYLSAGAIGAIGGWYAHKHTAEYVAKREMAKREKKKEKEAKKAEKAEKKALLKDAKEHPEKYISTDDVEIEDED